MPDEIQTPTCPLCRQPPALVLDGGHQAFCGTDGCPALAWNMYLDVDTLMENMAPAKIEQRSVGPSFTCPACGRTSYNLNDVAEGYCGNCHDWTRVS